MMSMRSTAPTTETTILFATGLPRLTEKWNARTRQLPMNAPMRPTTISPADAEFRAQNVRQAVIRPRNGLV
jgi:hypothetical protein